MRPRAEPDEDRSASHRRAAERLVAEGKYREAASEYQQWIGLAPNAAAAHGGLGACRFRLGEYQQAVESFRRALALDPNQQLAAFNLANTYGKIGDYASARRYLERTVEINPDSEEGKQARAMLDSMGSSLPEQPRRPTPR